VAFGLYPVDGVSALDYAVCDVRDMRGDHVSKRRPVPAAAATTALLLADAIEQLLDRGKPIQQAIRLIRIYDVVKIFSGANLFQIPTALIDRDGGKRPATITSALIHHAAHAQPLFAPVESRQSC